MYIYLIMSAWFPDNPSWDCPPDSTRVLSAWSSDKKAREELARLAPEGAGTIYSPGSNCFTVSALDGASTEYGIYEMEVDGNGQAW